MDRKTKQLLNQLESESAKERFLAVVELGKMRDTSLLSSLEKVATLDENKKVRQVAHQAVRYLSVLRDEEERAAMQARLEAEEEDDDSGDGWGTIEELLVEPLQDDDIDAGSDVWSYNEAVQARIDAEEEAQRAQDETKRRKRWRYRRFLWFSTLFVIIGLIFVAVYVEEHADDPETRQEALERLIEWHVDVQTVANRFEAAMVASDFDCAAYRQNEEEYQIPERAKGLGPDRPYQDDLEEEVNPLDATGESRPREFFSLMDEAIDDLEEFRGKVEDFCDGVETTRDWPPTATAKRQFSVPLTQSQENLFRAAQILNLAMQELETDGTPDDEMN